jgi:hypothetical protein
MRVRLSERQLNLIKEENKKISSYEKIKSHKIFPHLLDFIKDKENEESDSFYSTHHYSEIVNEMVKNYGIPYTLGAFTLLYYLIEDDVDPHEIMTLGDFTYKSNDIMGLLKASGYYDEYVLNRDSFRDIKKTEDGRILFSVDQWVDFAPLFREESIAEQVLGEDWFEIYGYYDGYPITEVVDALSDENVKYVIEAIIEKHEGESISGLEHREEFEDLLNEDGDLVIDDRLKTISDSYNLGILLSESELLNSDISSDLTNAYNSAHNSAAEGELWEEAKDEIEGYLGSEGKWTGEKGNILTFDVTDKYDELIDKHIEYDRDNPLDEYFSFIGMLEDIFKNHFSSRDMLTFRSNLDYFYPDSDNVERDFNDNIGSYF